MRQCTQDSVSTGARCRRAAVSGAETCSAHGGVEASSNPGGIRRQAAHPGVKCRATKSDGDPCGAYAIAGATVCRAHGGSAPQVKKKAKDRLLEAVDPLMDELLDIAHDKRQSTSDRLKAITWALERAGFSSKMEITHEVKPWEDDIAGILVDAPDVMDAEVEGDLPDALPDAVSDDLEARQAELDEEALDSVPDADVVPISTGGLLARQDRPRQGTSRVPHALRGHRLS